MCSTMSQSSSGPAVGATRWLLISDCKLPFPVSSGEAGERSLGDFLMPPPLPTRTDSLHSSCIFERNCVTFGENSEQCPIKNPSIYLHSNWTEQSVLHSLRHRSRYCLKWARTELEWTTPLDWWALSGQNWFAVRSPGRWSYLTCRYYSSCSAYALDWWSISWKHPCGDSFWMNAPHCWQWRVPCLNNSSPDRILTNLGQAKTKWLGKQQSNSMRARQQNESLRFTSSGACVWEHLRNICYLTKGFTAQR